MLLLACADSADLGPRIEGATPAPARAGERLAVEGRGFGEGGYVGLSGRPIQAESWSPSRIECVLPPDLGGGPLQLVVVAAGRPSPPYLLDVAGRRRAYRRPQRERPGANVEPSRDAGPRDAASDGPSPDVPLNLVAELTPDGGGNEVISLVGLDSEPGELRVAVRRPATDAWGVAFHLAYDRNLLRLIELESPAPELRALGAEIGPGRLAMGRVLSPGAGPDIAVLRFALVGRGVGRVDFPTRSRTLRDGENQPLPARWAGGSVRVFER